MKLSIKAGSTSQTVNVFIRDSSSTTGAGLTGLVFNSAGLTAYYALPKAAAVSITLATLAAITTAYASGGFKEVDATNMPGWYRLDLPDAAIASGRFVSLHLKGATNMAPLPVEIELTGWDNQDAVRGGLTSLPNVAAGASGGLPLSVDASGRVDVLKINGTSQTARDIGASVLLSAGTGTGQLDFTSGVVKANATQFAGQTITAGAGVTIPSSIASPTNITAGTITTVTNLTNAPTAGDFTATMKTSIGTAVAASAVASVTGNVGGNVTGSVGSVVGAVGSVTGLTASNLDVAVSTRLASASYTAPPTSTQNADALLNRDMSAVSDTNARSPLNAFRILRNKMSSSGGTLTVTKEDDTTTAWTAALTTDAAANPIIAVDPA